MLDNIFNGSKKIYIVGYHLPFHHNEQVPSAIYIAVVYKTSRSGEVSLSLSLSLSLSQSLNKSESSLEGE